MWPYGNCIFSYNLTDRIKLMILFHLQRLGAQRVELRLFDFWKIKFRKKCLKNVFQNFTFLCNCCVFFYGNKWEILFWGFRSAVVNLNSLQNDVRFNQLFQKVWEKIHFLLPKVNCSGDGKNTPLWTMCKINNLNNNENYWYIMFFYYYIDEITYKYAKKISSTKPRSTSLPPRFVKCLISIVEKNENYVEFYFRMGSVLVIFSFF